MEKTELLKNGRNLLLSLHKSLVDLERSVYEGSHGPVTSGQFLNLLLEDPNFEWLRRFSTLIVEIDEMYAQKDGFDSGAVDAHLDKVNELIEMKSGDVVFVARYRIAIQQDEDVAAKHAELRLLLKKS